MKPKEYYTNVVCKEVKKHFGHPHLAITDSILSSGFNGKVELQGDIEIKYGHPITLESDHRILEICEEIRAHYAVEENLEIGEYE